MPDQYSPQERETRHLNDMLPVWAGWVESGRPIEDTNRQLMGLDIRATATKFGELERELADVEDLCRHRFGLKRDAEARANRAEAALREARKWLTSVIAEEHEIQAELERHDQAWMATRLSYCTGGLVNLRAALDTSIEDRESEELCPRCHGQRCVPSQLHQGTEPCPDCKPPDDPEDSTGMPVVTGTKPPAPCSDPEVEDLRAVDRMARRLFHLPSGNTPSASQRDEARLAIARLASTQPPVPVPSGASGDWPEVFLSRPTPEADPENYEVWQRDNPPTEYEAETRKYVPAESEGKR
jgi:hypothetical protein